MSDERSHQSARAPNGGTIQSVTETSPARARPPIADQSGSDEPDWFVEMARDLLPKDAGLALHLFTGFEERTCYRYASGDRKPPAYFLRAILRSEQGGPFFVHLMQGAAPAWRREELRLMELGRRAERFLKAE